MKKAISVLVAIITILIVKVAFPQTSEIKVDSNLTINNVYAGLLNTVAFNTKEAVVTTNYSFRVGARATWQATKWMKVKTFATMDYSDGVATPINSFSVRLHAKGDQVYTEFGYVATPSTESRPLPTTAAGHFETFTEANIPGGAIGIKAGVTIGKGNTISGGAFIRNKEMEYHARFASKHIELSAFGNPTSREIGGSSVIKAGRVYNTTVFKNKISENIFCNFINVELNKKKDICFYLDFGYQVNTKEIKRMETGFFKTFSGKWVSGLVCLGYRYENKAICAYLFAHLP